MANRYTLTEKIREKYTPIVQEFIQKLEDSNPKDTDILLEVDFSDTELNPYTLGELLEELGYERGDQQENGWQLNFWIPYTKQGCKAIQVDGTGITFELKLMEKN
ncbi:hypothetical protein [Paenibacillus woosongensis]|uniref:Uncharacterized protein n=1 Tax=Paenibacillus woosongensis TaxID=307580 RepID=A0A7X3CNT8_9BACL|nr:hypothetical protein [Paenibacillus woosongensis]MUG45507.1 hypothetical protein [Paenibacillus woosongensis]